MSYKAGIVTAITELKDRTGSSSIAIKKNIQVRDFIFIGYVFMTLYLALSMNNAHGSTV